MEKISRIVGKSPRVGSADVKGSPPVRPGVPSFGRPVGTAVPAQKDDLTTAQKVSLIRDDMREQKKARSEARVAAEVTAAFFVRPEEPTGIKPGEVGASVAGPEARVSSAQISELEEPDLTAPSRFSPRGSYIDVHA